jgi:hypothetical protein
MQKKTQKQGLLKELFENNSKDVEMSTNLRKNLNIDDMKYSNKNEFDDGSE